MYVTLEPCPMCAGAIVQARIPKVVIGCMNPKAGCAGSVLDMLHEDGFNHQVETEVGLLGEECSQMLKDFFKALRELTKRLSTLLNSRSLGGVMHSLGGVLHSLGGTLGGLGITLGSLGATLDIFFRTSYHCIFRIPIKINTEPDL